MDKCFCHFNGYAVKDATARKDIEYLKAEYRLIELPLGDLMISVNEEPKNYELNNEEQLTAISKFINDVANSDITKPLFKFINTSFNSSGSGTLNTDCSEILFTTCVTDVVKTESIFMFYGFIQTSENDKWNVRVLVTGEWIEGVYVASSFRIWFTKQSTTGGSVDLTGYATEDYVDTAIENIEIPNLTGYATETYVNDAIANIDIPEGGGGDEIPKLETSTCTYLYNDGSVWLNSDNELMTKFRTMMTAYKDKKLYEFWLTYGKIPNSGIAGPWVVKFQLCTKSNYATMKEYSGDVTYKAVYPDNSDNSVMRSTILTFSSFGYDNTGSYIGGVPGSANITKYRCLTSQGTTAYTPTGDYHPATKKYVDDAIASVGTSAPVITEGTVANTSLFKTEGVECNITWKLIKVGKHCILRVYGEIPQKEDFEFVIDIPGNPTILGGSCARTCYMGLNTGAYRIFSSTANDNGILQMYVVGSNICEAEAHDTCTLSDQIEFYVE